MTIADTHVHIYPFYDLELFLVQACRNMDRCVTALRPRATTRFLSARVLYLAESGGCDWFRACVHGRIPLPRGWTLQYAEAALCLTLSHAEHGLLHIVQGRQVATAERLEVLGLAMQVSVPDGLPLAETLTRIEACGGTAVVPWALGKWLFNRGRLVTDLLRSSPPDRFLLGDSAMRPAPGLLPRLMRLARNLGFGVTAGSDPLPLPGEERLVGTFTVFAETVFDPEAPAELLRGLLQQPATHSPRILGRRRGYGSVLFKAIQLRSRKKPHSFQGREQTLPEHTDHA